MSRNETSITYVNCLAFIKHSVKKIVDASLITMTSFDNKLSRSQFYETVLANKTLLTKKNAYFSQDNLNFSADRELCELIGHKLECSCLIIL